jgi:hypothetical protein
MHIMVWLFTGWVDACQSTIVYVALYERRKSAQVLCAVARIPRSSGAGGVGSIPANPDAQNLPSFRRWRFEMKLSPCAVAVSSILGRLPLVLVGDTGTIPCEMRGESAKFPGASCDKTQSGEQLCPVMGNQAHTLTSVIITWESTNLNSTAAPVCLRPVVTYRRPATQPSPVVS